MALRQGYRLFAGGVLIQVATMAAAAEVVEMGDTASLEQRIQHLERIVQGQGLSELLLQVEQLQAEVRRLQGETEGLQHEIEGLKGKQRELYLDLDRRLQELNSPAETSSSPSAQEVTKDTDTSAEEPTTVDPGEQAYQTALGMLKEGHYKEAATAFSQFPQQYPDSGYRPNAQYWLGEAYYMLHDFSAAVEAFQVLVNQYPGSPKVSNAMLKQGLSYYELEQWEQAKNKLHEVVTGYPDSTASRLAEEHLEKMKREGHI
jgi:tol-pal system protein YbgF